MIITMMMMMMMRNFIKLNPRAVKLKRNVIIGTKLAYTLTYLLYKKNTDVFQKKRQGHYFQVQPTSYESFSKSVRNSFLRSTSYRLRSTFEHDSSFFQSLPTSISVFRLNQSAFCTEKNECVFLLNFAPAFIMGNPMLCNLIFHKAVAITICTERV